MWVADCALRVCLNDFPGLFVADILIVAGPWLFSPVLLPEGVVSVDCGSFVDE